MPLAARAIRRGPPAIAAGATCGRWSGPSDSGEQVAPLAGVLGIDVGGYAVLAAVAFPLHDFNGLSDDGAGFG
jgi:hypothetical protein